MPRDPLSANFKRPREGSHSSNTKPDSKSTEKRLRFDLPPQPSSSKQDRHAYGNGVDDYDDGDSEGADALDPEFDPISAISFKAQTLRGDGSDSSDGESVESDDSDRQFHKSVTEKKDGRDGDQDPNGSNGRKRGKESEADMDVDMFGDADQETADSSTNAKDGAKSKRALRIDEIEGQEFDTPGNMIDKQPSQDSDDNDEGPKEKIEAFNMKSDYEQGHFDETGNFVWKEKDPQAIHDVWLDGIGKRDIHKAMEAENRRKERIDQQAKKEREAAKNLSESELLVGLVSLMKPGETVLAAMSRLGGNKKKSKNKWLNKNRRKKNKGKSEETDTKMKEEEEEEGDGEAERQRKENIERLTELSNYMMGRGKMDVYEQTFEGMIRQLRVRGVLADDWMVGDPLPSASGPSNVSQPSASDDVNDMFQD